MTLADQTRFDEIQERLEGARERIRRACAASGRGPVELIVVTKTHPRSDIDILYQLGVRAVGENRDQEGREKSVGAPPDLVWHMIGQIQSKKINSITRWADVVQTIDRVELIDAFSRAAQTQEKNLGVMIQVSLDPHAPPGRGGVQPDQVPILAERVAQAANVHLLGVMAVAPHPTTGIAAADAFSRLATVSAALRAQFPQAIEISAGMSGDVEEAIAHGATQVRLGSVILGERPYVE